MLEVATKIEFKFHSVDNLKSVNDIYQKIKNDKSNCINFYWLGIRDYNQIWDLQKKVHKLKIKEKIGDVVLLLEHNHVYTLGKNANENHIITSNESIERVKIDRGGDVTYHGPGQLVGYPIIDLHNYKMSISWYLSLISKSIIDLLLSINSDDDLKQMAKDFGLDDKTIKEIFKK